MGNPYKTKSDQGPRNAKALYLAVVLPAVLVIAAVLIQPWIPIARLFRDPLAVAQDAAAIGECCEAYFGAISLLGGLVWAAGAAISLFAAAFLRSRNASGAGFLAAGGLLTALLTVDDVFQGHEEIYPRLFGASEEIMVGIYALMAIAYFAIFRRRILAIGPGLLVLAVVAFAVAVAVDLTVSEGVSWHRIGEDGTKLIGVFAWTGFHIRAAWVELAAAGQAGRTQHDGIAKVTRVASP